MSAFLGPIHELMYHRILMQESLTDKFLCFAKDQEKIKDLREKVDAQYPRSEEVPLEQIIDQSNIHGWLDNRVNTVENRLSMVVSAILEADENSLSQLKQIAGQFGAEQSQQSPDTAEDLYRQFDRLLLDGMPCAGGRMVESSSPDEVVWHYDSGNHPLSNPVKGIQDPYATLRQAMLEGMAEHTDYMLEALGNGAYKIRKRV